MLKKTKMCPYCAERVLAAAIKCRFCGERLAVETETDTVPESNLQPEDGRTSPPTRDLPALVQSATVADGAGKMCAYCKSSIDAAASTVMCPVCAARHHAECWQKSGRCATNGCLGYEWALRPPTLSPHDILEMVDVLPPLWMRMLAYAVDVVLVSTIYTAAGVVFTQRQGVQPLLFLFLVYQVGMTTACSATLGKMVFRLRVIDEHGAGVVFWAVLLRYVVLDLLGPWSALAIIWNDKNQCVHDLAAKTLVVRLPKGLSAPQ